jgi:hypothetical protein
MRSFPARLLLGGCGYDDAYLKAAGKDAPKFTDEEMKIIGTPLDFVGINVDISLFLVVAADQPSFNLPASLILKTRRRRSGSVASIP